MDKEITARIWVPSERKEYPSGLFPKEIISLDELSAVLGFEVEPESIESREFRKKYRITLAAEAKAKDNETVYEMDVINVGDTGSYHSNHGLRYKWLSDGFKLQRAGESVAWNKDTGAKCRRVASYYENQAMYRDVFNTHLGL